MIQRAASLLLTLDKPLFKKVFAENLIYLIIAITMFQVYWMYFANAWFNYDILCVPFPIIIFLCIMHILNSQKAVCKEENEYVEN